MVRHFVIMGVAGSGKSHIGAALAQKLGMIYLDGDDFHPSANVDKMSRGEALTDEDRWPWLEIVGDVLAKAQDSTIVGCSALKRRYRDRIRAATPDAVFIYLDGDRDLIAKRMGARDGHFMPLSLLDSQFAALERLAQDEAHVSVGIDATPDQIVADIANALAASHHI